DEHDEKKSESHEAKLDEHNEKSESHESHETPSIEAENIAFEDGEISTVSDGFTVIDGTTFPIEDFELSTPSRTIAQEAVTTATKTATITTQFVNAPEIP